jgi:hypothetical protein
MPDQPTPALASEEDQTIFDVLSRLLMLYPAQLTDEELTRELTSGAEDFDSQDAIYRAIRDLIAVGLIHRHGSFVWPTRAPARFWELVNAGM